MNANLARVSLVELAESQDFFQNHLASFDYSKLGKIPACSCSIEEILAVNGDMAARDSVMAVHFDVSQHISNSVRNSNFKNSEFISVCPKFRKYATSEI